MEMNPGDHGISVGEWMGLDGMGVAIRRSFEIWLTQLGEGQKRKHKHLLYLINFHPHGEEQLYIQEHFRSLTSKTGTGDSLYR